MNVESNEQTNTYEGRTSPLSVTGNNKTFNIKASTMPITVTGNVNCFYLQDSTVELTITGNGNTIFLKTTSLKLSLTGNSNEVKLDNSQGSSVLVLRKAGYGNILPEGTKYAIIPNPPIISQHISHNLGPSTFTQHYAMRNYEGSRSTGVTSSHRNSRGLIINGNGSYLLDNSRGYSGSTQPINQLVQPEPWVRRPARPRVDQALKVERPSGLNEEDINRLPIAKYDGKKPYDCSICCQQINEGDEIVYLVCFHFYHTDCCLSWLKKSVTCPICKVDLKKKLQEVQFNEE